MAKYIRDCDSEEFTEEEIWDVVCEEVSEDHMEEVLRGLSWSYIWEHLDDVARDRVWEDAKDLCFEENFALIEEDEEDEDED